MNGRDIYVGNGKLDHGLKMAVAALGPDKSLIVHRCCMAGTSGPDVEFETIDRVFRAIHEVYSNPEAEGQSKELEASFDFYLQLFPGFLEACGGQVPFSS